MSHDYYVTIEAPFLWWSSSERSPSVTDDLEKQADETAPEAEPGENGGAGNADTEPSVETDESSTDQPATPEADEASA